MAKQRILLLLAGVLMPLLASTQVHTSYLWHLQQPIYWPEASTWDPYNYQTAWESHVLKTSGGNLYADGLNHPLNDLFDIFSKADRVAVYQYRTKDAIQNLLGYPEGGAQVNYSGCLIENVNSLADNFQWGYAPGWENNFITGRSWTTTGGNPRMDLTGFTFHHVLAPLVSEEVLRKEIRAHRHIYGQTFGTSPNYSKGFWPAECSFSERIIKVLVEEGFEWTVVANHHLARTLADYPLNFSTAGSNYDAPNQADVTGMTGNNWWSGSIDGRGGAFAAPFCYQAHNAKYVDPATGSEYQMVVVPMGDLLSYQDGFQAMGTGDIDAHVAPYDDPSHPSIVLLAHDGDNAYGGGFSYYMESVPNFASAASANGYTPTTIQQFLDDHPVPSSDLVHVEDGSWVNAANDWGHPQFINWLWPLFNPSTHEFDPNGWTEDARNWAVLTAAENHVIMAEDLAGTADIGEIVDPGPSSNNAERAWHHLLPGFTSGYMYYGSSIDMEVKQTIAANKALEFANLEIAANPGIDNTRPSVFIPQRYPYNPGGTGFGPNYGYSTFPNPSDFHVWTFAYDVSGLSSVVLKYRLDADGVNPLTNNDNETYSGGSGIGSWNSVPMTEKDFPKTNVTGNPDIDFFVLPDEIANLYYAPVTGLSETLVDYYVEATDSAGNVFRSPIQHVYVGETTPVGGGAATVSWEPANPLPGDTITITVEDAALGANLHWAVFSGGQNWTTPDNTYWPSGTVLFNGTGPAVETAMSGPDADNKLTIKIGPFNDPVQEVNGIDFVIHYDNDTWDNNGGSDYFIPIGDQPVGVYWEPANPGKDDIVTIKVTDAALGAQLHWGVNDGSPWQTPNAVYWPAGSYLFNGTGPAIESAFSGPDANGELSIQVGPFNDPSQLVNEVNFVIHYNDDTWDNNGGADYLIPINNDPPDCVVPPVLFTDNITTNSATLNWSAVDGALGYILQGRQVGGPAGSLNLTDGSITSFNLSGLSPGASYEWRLRTVCSTASSPFSGVQSFTTNPLLREEGLSGLSVFPNPFDQQATLRFSNPENKAYDLRISDMQGREVLLVPGIRGNSFNIERQSLSPGMYILRLVGDDVRTTRIVIQ